MVVVQYADWTAYDRALAGFAEDPEHRKIVAEISKVVEFISRELVVDLDL